MFDVVISERIRVVISSASHLNAVACVVALLGGGSEYDCDLMKVQRAAHDAHLFEFASIDVWEASSTG